MRGSIVFVVLLAASVARAGGATDPPPAAADILAEVQKYYAGIPQLTAKFGQTVTHKAFGTTQHSSGTVMVTKPASFRWEYAVKTSKGTHVAKSFIYDGKTLWVIDHDSKRASYGATTGDLPAAVSFLTGGASLGTQFTVAVNTDGKYGGKGTTVLELTPKQASAAYTKLFFVVDGFDSHIRESIVISSNGDINDFAFYEPDTKTSIKPSLFTVNPAKLTGYAIEKLTAPASGAPAQPPQSP